MNIDFYVPYRLLEQDSRSTSIKCLTSELSKEGHCIRILTPHSDFELNKYDFKIIEGLHLFSSFIVGNLLLNIKYLFISKPDVLIIRPDSFLFQSFRLKKNLIKVFNLHTCIEEEARINKLSIYHKTNMMITSRFRKKFLEKIDGIVFNHPDLEDYYRGFTNKKTTSIYNGINTIDFLPCKNNSIEDDIICGFVGNISVWHGLEEVCSYFNRYNNYTDSKKVKFIVIGDANFKTKKMLESYDFVNYVGRKTKSEVNTMLSDCNFCVVNVLNIRVSPGSPIKLFDYIAMKKPILTTHNVRGYSDIVVKYNLGTTVDFHSNDFTDFECFLSKITSFDGDFDSAIKEYSWKSQSIKWISFIKQL